jgi:hypothetical protein
MLGLFFAPDNRAMQFVRVDAPPLTAVSNSQMRPVAGWVAHSFRSPPTDLLRRARSTCQQPLEAGRVHSAGAWTDVGIHRAIAAALDPTLAPALRTRLEWYWCQGAFFHTDAHYGDVLFGVWYLGGPPIDIVFPRAGLRVGADAGTVLVFDPFEVHGVLRPDAVAYRADDYTHSDVSVFVGFEVDLVPAVRKRFGMGHVAADARVVSSATRVSAATGAFE